MRKSSNNILYVVTVSTLAVVAPILVGIVLSESGSAKALDVLLSGDLKLLGSTLFVFLFYGTPVIMGCILYCVVFLLLEKHDDSFSLRSFSKKVMVISAPLFVLGEIILEYRGLGFLILLFSLSLILLLTKKKYYRE